MRTTWKKVSLEEAKSHPLYGVKNWLAVFAFGVLLSLLKEIGTLGGEAHKAGLSLSQLLAIDHPAITFAKIVLAVNVVLVSVIYWMLITKHPKFRRVATGLLLLGWPTIVLVGGINPFDGLGAAIGMSLLPWALSCAIWVTYLQRSKRVRVTFEHSVVSDETSSTVPKNSQVPFPTHAVSTRQFSTPTAQKTPSLNMAEMVGIVARKPPEEISLESKPSTPSEECWSMAIAEFDSASRRAGLWARMFSEAEGNEAIAKAGYLRHRASEVHRDQTEILEKQSLRLEEQARDTALAALTSQQREYAKLLKGICPNCGDLVPSDSKKCAACKAVFDSSSAWKITTFSESEQIEALRATFQQGKKPTPNQVIFLAAASSWDRSLTMLTDKTGNGDTLLHWCAQYGLASGAATLIANGANASAANTSGIKPFEVCTDPNLRGLLTFAAYKSET